MDEELTKYESARILGARALQIAMGAPFLIKINEKELKRIKYNPIEIAKLELEKGVIPMQVKRPMPVPKSMLEQEEESAEEKPAEE